MTEALIKIHVEGYRSLRCTTLEPGRITVLIGANGSGKSNLLSFLSMVPQLRTRSLGRFVGNAGGASALLHYGPDHTKEIAFQIEFQSDDHTNSYGARLGFAAGDRLVFLDEEVAYSSSDRPKRSFSLGAGHFEARIDDEGKNRDKPAAKHVRSWLSQMSFYHFHDTSATSTLRTNSRGEDDRYFRSDGSNLAGWLYRLKQGETEEHRLSWRRLHDLLAQVAPLIKELDPVEAATYSTGVAEGTRPTAPAHPTSIRLDWIDDRDERFGSHHLSDGSLRAIALLTALTQPDEILPRFICIDEPELGLHPAGIAVLADLIRSISARCQVLLATQSPALLDHFGAKDVVVAQRVAGETSLQRLDPSALGKWLQSYSLSELFDKNVFGGRP